MTLKNLAIIGLICAAVCAPQHAQAASTSEMVRMCAQEMDAQSIASADDYRPKMKKISGAGLKRLTIEMIPLTDDGEKMTVECRVKRGKVVDVAVK